jgi:hypothetical protein
VRTDSPINPIFLANMRQLWRANARLAQRIDDLPFDASLELQPSKSGPPTASVVTSDGRRIYLHSRYDPVREAAEFCKTLEKPDAACIVLCGLGLGYHVKALFEIYGDESSILIGEPDLVTIKTALERTDLSKELSTGRIEFITDLEKAALHERLQRHFTLLMLGTLFAVPPVSRDYHADFHADFRQAIMDYAAFAKLSLVTLVKNAAITCKNIANNLPTYLSTPPADILRDRFKGFPAILVAAGPSLSKNINELAQLAPGESPGAKCVIIAAQTTLRPLLARGIKPHFVTSLDFSEMSRQFFEGLDIPADTVLVAEPKASWHVIDTFRSANVVQPPSAVNRSHRVILLDNEFAHRCVGEDLAKRTPMEAGATVMHLAFYLAQWLGCDPIIFIGQDLAFTGHCYYSPGVAIHRAWSAETSRFCTLEMKEWERIVRHRSILRKVKDIDGRDIYTDDQMFTYLEQFERDFARCPATIIDATQGGARKTGAQVMSLSDAAKQFCRSTLDPRRFDYLQSRWHDPTKLRPGGDRLRARLAELAEFHGLCKETRKLLAELQSLVNDPPRFNRRLVRVDELRTLVQEHDLIFAMVRDVSQLGELQRFSADRGLTADDSAGGRRARRQLDRDIRFLDSLLEGAEQLRGILEESLARFDQALEAQS